MLITCPECGKEVSDTIEQCIHCGFHLKPKQPEHNEHPRSKRIALGLRGPSGKGLRFWSVFGVVLSFFGSIGFIIAMMEELLEVFQDILHSHFYDYIPVFLYSPGIGVFVLCFVAIIINWHRMALNGHNGKPLLYVLEGDEQVHLVALNGQEVLVDPDQLVSLSRGASTDWIVKARYLDDNQQMRSLLLGWTSSPKQLEESFAKLKSYQG